MRALIFLSLVLIAIVQVHAQEKTPLQIPEVVNNTFQKQYPQVEEVKWKEKKEEYKADFKVGKTDHELWITKAGVIAKHSYEIKDSELPVVVKNIITTDFALYKIGDCERTDIRSLSTYKVELKSDAGKKNVHFTPKGKVIQKKD